MQDRYFGLIPPTPDYNFLDRNAAVFHGALGTRAKLQEFLQGINDPAVKTFPFHGNIHYDFEENIVREIPYFDPSRYRNYGNSLFRDGNRYYTWQQLPRFNATKYVTDQIKTVGDSFLSGYFVYKDKGNNDFSIAFIGYAKNAKDNDNYTVGAVKTESTKNKVNVLPFFPNSKTPNPESFVWNRINHLPTTLSTSDPKSRDMGILSQNNEVIEKVRTNMQDVLSSFKASL